MKPEVQMKMQCIIVTHRHTYQLKAFLLSAFLPLCDQLLLPCCFVIAFGSNVNVKNNSNCWILFESRTQT